MIVIFPFSYREHEAAVRLANWIVQLGGVKKHECIVMASRQANEAGHADGIAFVLGKAFGKVDTFVPADEDETGWPNSANHMWRRAVQEMEWNRGGEPFFWIEMDAVPLVPEWLDRIQAEYISGCKSFMGARVQVEGVRVHMTGIAVYRNVMRHCPQYASIAYQKDPTQPGKQFPWDVQLADNLLPNAHITNLIQHEWRPGGFDTPESLNRLNKASVIYHQVKNSSLTDRLMERLGKPAESPKTGEPVSRDIQTKAAQEAHAPTNGHSRTLADQLREHVNALHKLVGGKVDRKARLHTELRRVKLMAPAKRRG